MLQQGISRIPLDRKWGFAADPEHRGRQEGWWSTGLPVKKEVLVPHTWNVDPETEDYRGLGWYEYPFEIRDMDSSNRIWFHFEAVYRDATVWINGQEAGSHTNSGYTSFRIEATPYLVQGGNLLIVAVDNRYSDTALPKVNSFDWADDGGMIREVTLMVTGEAAIEFVQIDAIPVLHEQKPTQIRRNHQGGRYVSRNSEDQHQSSPASTFGRTERTNNLGRFKDRIFSLSHHSIIRYCSG
ncbi:sugar-binding domain-containing protein [Paenibacillus sp. DYY-L-2]|uniref:sugar-binding domain-containing protein n=1 Tax=Paenibacillus sp. DYY-L-2 TaxID=3447013 RepID=UPI003F507E63